MNISSPMQVQCLGMRFRAVTPNPTRALSKLPAQGPLCLPQQLSLRAPILVPPCPYSCHRACAYLCSEATPHHHLSVLGEEGLSHSKEMCLSPSAFALGPLILITSPNTYTCFVKPVRNTRQVEPDRSPLAHSATSPSSEILNSVTCASINSQRRIPKWGTSPKGSQSHPSLSCSQIS